MFGQPIAVPSKTGIWLEMLRQAEPKTRRGELMVRNLREDANVCPALQQQLRDQLLIAPCGQPTRIA